MISFFSRQFKIFLKLSTLGLKPRWIMWVQLWTQGSRPPPPCLDLTPPWVANFTIVQHIDRGGLDWIGCIYFKQFQILNLRKSNLKRKRFYFISSNVKAKLQNISLLKSTQKRYNCKQIDCTEKFTKSVFISLTSHYCKVPTCTIEI